MCLPVTYLRIILLSIFIVFADSTIAQMSLCIPLNVLCLLYFIKARPYSFKFKKRRFRNYIAIFNEATLIIFEILMLALGMLHRDGFSAAQKQEFSMTIVIYLIVVTLVNLVYFLFRIGVQFWRRIVLPFSETELFRVNFP